MRVYRRKDSPYYWTSGTAKGRRYRRSTGETQKKLAEGAAARIHGEEMARPGRKDSWRLTDCIGTYWHDHGQHQKSSDFIWTKICAIERNLDVNAAMAGLTNAQLLEYRARRRGEGVGGATINRDLAILKAALNHAALMHGQVAPAIAWKKLRYSENEIRVRFLSIEEYQALIEAADKDMAFAILAAVATGLRKTSMLDLKWHQVDLSAKAITIPRGKGKRPQVVRIAEALRYELLARRKRSGYVFLRGNFRKRWEAARAAAGIEDFHWHDLRHTFGSWARQGGADLLDIMDAMGHSSSAVTMRYAHVDPETHVTAFDRAGQKLSRSVSRDDSKTA